MIVTFDSNIFRNRHPYFTEDKVTDDALEYQFEIACGIVGNSDDSVVPYNPDEGIFDRDKVLDLLTCHLVTLSLRDPNQSGVVQSATQGSVSVSYATQQGRGEYYNQTPCGNSFFNLMKRYRKWGGIGVNPVNYHPYG